MRRTLAVALVFALYTPQANAGAWVQGDGGLYTKTALRVVRANSLYEPGGERVSIPTLGDYTVSFYGEYGLWPWLTAVWNLPFYRRLTLNKQVGRTSGTVFSEGDSVNGVADADVGLRARLLTLGKLVASVEGMAGIPSGSDSQPNGLLTGDGEFNWLSSLQVGYSLYPLPAYASGSVGFNLRTAGFSDEVRYSLEAGWTFAERVLLIGRLRGQESLQNGAGPSTQSAMSGLAANDQELLGWGAELVVQASQNVGISAGVESAFRAKNLVSGLAYTIGVSVTH